MKKLLALLLVLPFAASSAPTRGPNTAVQWDFPIPMPGDVDGFRFYCGEPAVIKWEGTGTVVADAYQVALSDTVMEQGRQDCYMSAYNAVDESDPSNSIEIKYVTGKPTNSPVNLR